MYGRDGEIKMLLQCKGPSPPHFTISRGSQIASQQEQVSVTPDKRAVQGPFSFRHTGQHASHLLSPELWASDWQGFRTTFWEAETERPK